MFTSSKLRECFEKEFPDDEFSLSFKTKVQTLFNQAVEEKVQMLLERNGIKSNLMRERVAKVSRLLS